MKPMGPIPPDYAADADGMLLIGGERADVLAERAGDTPLFVYDLGVVRARVAAFREAMPVGVALHYAIKANPYPPLLAAMAALVDGFDVASEGELRLALDAGMLPSAISFAGPGKRDRELQAAIRAGVTLNAESEGEVARAIAIAQGLGRPARIAVRVNPDFDLKGSGMRMGGGAKPFGVDAARVPALVREIVASSAAEWRGFHIFAGSQSLDSAAIVEAQAATLALVLELSAESGAMAPTVNLGGGFGVPYFAGDRPIDLDTIGKSLSKQLKNGKQSATSSAIELGRWLVAEAGVYLTRIVDKKISHGQTFLICDGGLHHQLAATGNFGTVVRRNYPLALARRFGTDDALETVSVVGPLCTPLDRLGDQLGLPAAAPGDLIAVFLAGAYGATASPSAFLGHPPAQEILLNA